MLILKERVENGIDSKKDESLEIWDNVVLTDSKYPSNLGVGLVMGFYGNNVCVVFEINNPSMTFIVHESEIEKI